MTKKEAWKYYKTWMEEKTFSPALNCNIKITRKGWDHLTKGTKRRRRNSRDEKFKLSLLKHAKYVIKNAKVCSVRDISRVRYYSLAYKVKSKVNGRYKYIKIRVLLKKDTRDNYYLYSIMKE